MSLSSSLSLSLSSQGWTRCLTTAPWRWPGWGCPCTGCTGAWPSWGATTPAWCPSTRSSGTRTARSSTGWQPGSSQQRLNGPNLWRFPLHCSASLHLIHCSYLPGKADPITIHNVEGITLDVSVMSDNCQHQSWPALMLISSLSSPHYHHRLASFVSKLSMYFRGAAATLTKCTSRPCPRPARAATGARSVRRGRCSPRTASTETSWSWSSPRTGPPSQASWRTGRERYCVRDRSIIQYIPPIFIFIKWRHQMRAWIIPFLLLPTYLFANNWN